MKNPNGFGSVSLIGGKKDKKKRRNPYRVRVTDRWEWDEAKGKEVQKFRTIGYYPDRKTAMMALAEYNKMPIEKGTADLTFNDIFMQWKKSRYDKLSETAILGYNNSYKHSEPLYNMKMCEIKAEHLEDVMNNLTFGVAGQKVLKTFWNQLFDFAIKKDIIHKNYVKFVKTKDKGSNSSTRVPFTHEQVDMLWENLKKVDGVDTVLILIYTGMRPSEMLEMKVENIHLKERYMVGGSKTEAGKNRVIPIHERIVPLIKKRMAAGGEYLLPRYTENKRNAYDAYYRSMWKNVKENLPIGDLSPHCCRHTAISFLAEKGVDQRSIKRIVGHSSGDITDRYTKQSIDFLVNEINKLD